MNATTSTPTIHLFNGREMSIPTLSCVVVTAAFPRRHRPLPRPRRRLKPRPPLTLSPTNVGDHRDINLSIDLDSVAHRVSSNLLRFVAAGADAFDDLRTSVRIDPGHHVVFSCRRSSVLFVTTFIFWSAVAVVAVRAVASLGFWSRWGFGDGRQVVMRRDRSLGGREVVVGMRSSGESKNFGRFSVNPVSKSNFEEGIEWGFRGKWKGKKEEKLPEWWPESISKPTGLVGDEELRREADRLVRAIIDKRLSGKDYKDDDIIQLRQICKLSGASVSFGTANVRDSFYRASVDFVLSICSRVMQPAATVQIDGEEARQFISGLADNIGLEKISAARIIRAAVAARTRSCFLQSWAFEVQGKRFEALKELSKICQIFQIFPPEEYSPEMEMVAGGLKKTLGIEQRKHLLALFKEVCGSNCQKISEEALGLVYPNGNEGGSDDGSHTVKFQLL